MIGHTADTEGFRTRVAADGREIGVHSRPDVGVQPWVAVFCAEYDVKDDLATRLRHGGDNSRRGLLDESRFLRWLVCVCNPGELPQAHMKAAPLALKQIPS